MGLSGPTRLELFDRPLARRPWQRPSRLAAIVPRHRAMRGSTDRDRLRRSHPPLPASERHTGRDSNFRLDQHGRICPFAPVTPARAGAIISRNKRDGFAPTEGLCSRGDRVQGGTRLTASPVKKRSFLHLDKSSFRWTLRILHLRLKLVMPAKATAKYASRGASQRGHHTPPAAPWRSPAFDW